MKVRNAQENERSPYNVNLQLYGAGTLQPSICQNNNYQFFPQEFYQHHLSFLPHLKYRKKVSYRVQITLAFYLSFLSPCLVGWGDFSIPFTQGQNEPGDVTGGLQVILEKHCWKFRELDLVLALPPPAICPQTSHFTFLSFILTLGSYFQSNTIGGHWLVLVVENPKNNMGWDLLTMHTGLSQCLPPNSEMQL